MKLSTVHENYANTWWTPPEWLKWAQETLNTPTPFDPCPRNWNSIISPDGLEMPWDRDVYCNHPGARGSARKWWRKAMQELDTGAMERFVWCQFNVEGLRHLDPSPFLLEGWLVWPRERTSFIWGGPDLVVSGKTRYHGKPTPSPGHCAVWWTNCTPADPPVKSLVIRTGGDCAYR